MTTPGCHDGAMDKRVETAEHQEMVARLKEVRAAAIEAARRTVELARERRRIMEALLAEGSRRPTSRGNWASPARRSRR